MSKPMETLFKKELENPNDLYEKLIPHKENWHGGKTFIYNNKNENENTSVNQDVNQEYEQYKTVIVKNNELEEKYFIYDEIITSRIDSQKKYMSILRLFNDKEKKIKESIIFLKENFIMQVIRNLTYEDFKLELVANKKLSDLQENEKTTFIKAPFLEFINKINEEEKQNNNNDSNNINYELLKRNRRKWQVTKWTVFVVSWVGIGLLAIALGFAFSPLIAPLAALMGNGAIATAGASAVFGTITTIVSGITVGIIVKQWNKRKHKWKKRWLPNWKSKSEIANDMKLQEEKNKIEAKMQNELYLSLTDDQKQKRIFNAFKENINKDKNKDFETLSQELNDKFKENKLNLVTINYEQELKKINENQISLKDNPEHIIEEAYKGYYPKIFAN